MTNIRLSVSNYRCFGATKPATFELGPGVTAFVGPNNAGKSTLLRFFWEFRSLFASLGDDANVLERSVGRLTPFTLPIDDPGQIFHDGNAGDLVVDLLLPAPQTSDPQPADRIQITVPRGTNQFNSRLFVRRKPLDSIHHWTDGYPSDSNSQPLADPGPIRSALQLLARTRYIGPRRSTTSQAPGQDFDSVTGSNLITTWRALKGGTKAARAGAHDIERRLASLFGFNNLTITTSENGQELIVGVEEQSYRIDELGSGLGHFAVALLTLGQSGGASWVLVDEPENGLHPTMQLEFIRTLAAEASEGAVFATHSYGLARRAAARLYLVRQAHGAHHSNVSEPRKAASLAEFLGEMGYSGYRDQGYDRLLLVEGPRDVLVVDELRRLIPNGADVVVLPLGGSDAINSSPDQQLSEIARLSKHVFALVDSERSAPDEPLSAARGTFVETCAALGIQCHVLTRRSIENYLPDRAIQRVMGPDARALAPYERAPNSLKSKQTEVARQMTIEDLHGTDLLTFLRKVYSRRVS